MNLAQKNIVVEGFFDILKRVTIQALCKLEETCQNDALDIIKINNTKIITPLQEKSITLNTNDLRSQGQHITPSGVVIHQKEKGTKYRRKSSSSVSISSDQKGSIMVFSNYKQGKEEKLTKDRKRIRNITTTTTTTSIENKAPHLDLPEDFKKLDMAANKHSVQEKLLDYTFDSLKHTTQKENFIIGYNLIGEQQRRITQPKYLEEKIIKMQTQVTQQQVQSSPQITSRSPSVDSDCAFKNTVAEEIGIDQKSQSRYFQQNPFEYCYRCRQPGHQERQCVVQPSQSCSFCLCPDHTGEKCSQNACFKCHQIGHRKMECNIRVDRRLFCQLCRDVGHEHYNCGRLINSKQSDLQEIICLSCKKKGHINCSLLLDDDFFKSEIVN